MLLQQMLLPLLLLLLLLFSMLPLLPLRLLWMLLLRLRLWLQPLLPLLLLVLVLLRHRSDDSGLKDWDGDRVHSYSHSQSSTQIFKASEFKAEQPGERTKSTKC